MRPGVAGSLPHGDWGSRGFNKTFEVRRVRSLTGSTGRLPDCFNMCGVCHAIRQPKPPLVGPVLRGTFRRQSIQAGRGPLGPTLVGVGGLGTQGVRPICLA